MDGIGSTEMLHIFIGSPEEEIRPGATGRPVPVLDNPTPIKELI